MKKNSQGLTVLKTLIAVVANLSAYEYHSIKPSGHFPFLEGVFFVLLYQNNREYLLKSK